MAPTGKNVFMTSFMRPVLNHPDLSIGNFIISCEGPPKIQSIIDWQGTSVVPFFVQCQPAKGMIYVTRAVDSAPDGSPVPPADFDSMSPEDLDHIRRHIYYARTMYPRRLHVAPSRRIGASISFLIHSALHSGWTHGFV